MDGRYKYLIKNVGLLTIGQFGTKILSFFLVPLYTSILTTAEYGTYDLFNTTIGLFVPIFTLNIAESSLRFAIDEDSNKKEIFSISIVYILISSVIITIVIGINHIFGLIKVVDDYGYLFILMFIVNALVGMLTNFTRGINRISDVSISGLICTIVMLCLNILFLTYFRMGIIGYFWANILGSLAQSLYLFIHIKGWLYINVKFLNKKTNKEMTDYSKPLITNSISWWINNASDRYIVTLFCGIAENGIYSVGYKIPSILNIFQNIFNQAWTLSAVRNFDAEDKDDFFSKMYNLYNFGMVLLCSLMIVFTKILAHLLYAKDFFEAWKYVPFLMVAIVFGSVSGYIGGIFSAAKQSKIFARSTVIGAIINLVLNIVLVYFIDSLGAAIATAIAFWIVWVIRVKHLKKYMRIKLYLLRDYFSYFILIIQSVLLIAFNDNIFLYIMECILTLFIMLLYYKELTGLIKKLKASKGDRFSEFSL